MVCLTSNGLSQPTAPRVASGSLLRLQAGVRASKIEDLRRSEVRQPLQYLGFPLWDEALVLRHARQRGAQRLSKLGGIEYLAELLAGGEVWRRPTRHCGAGRAARGDGQRVHKLRRSKQPDWSLKTWGIETPDPSKGFGPDPSRLGRRSSFPLQEILRIMEL